MNELEIRAILLQTSSWNVWARARSLYKVVTLFAIHITIAMSRDRIGIYHVAMKRENIQLVASRSLRFVHYNFISTGYQSMFFISSHESCLICYKSKWVTFFVKFLSLSSYWLWYTAYHIHFWYNVVEFSQRFDIWSNYWSYL